MRWYVYVTSPNGAQPERVRTCVEADSWQRALEMVRGQRGELGPMAGFSVELTDEGWRTVDPSTHTRFEVMRAPDDAGITRVGDERPSLVGRRILYHREEPQAADFPIEYRERVYVLDEGASEDDAARLLEDEFDRLRDSLSEIPSGKLVQLAAFESGFQAKSPVLPMATLVWRDWRGGPAVRHPRRASASADKARTIVGMPAPVLLEPVATPYAPPPAPAFVAAPAPAPQGPPPLPQRVHHAVAPAAAPAPAPAVRVQAPQAPPSVRPVAPPFGSTPAPPSVQVAPAPVPAAVAPVPAPRPLAAFGATQPMVPSPIREVGPARAPSSSDATPTTPANQAATKPSNPKDTLPMKAVEVPATKPANAKDTLPMKPAEVFVPRPTAAKQAPPAKRVDPAAVAKAKAPMAVALATPSPAGVAQRAGRVRGEELITALFEAMHDLSFAGDALDGAEFCAGLLREKLPARALYVHFYDINRREFVIVHASGAGGEGSLLKRHPESDPVLSMAMRRRRAVTVDASSLVALASIERFSRVDTKLGVLVAPAMVAGRFLGAFELACPTDGAPFSQEDANALSYIGQQFGEFLAQRSVVIDPAAVQQRAAAVAPS